MNKRWQSTIRRSEADGRSVNRDLIQSVQGWKQIMWEPLFSVWTRQVAWWRPQRTKSGYIHMDVAHFIKSVEKLSQYGVILLSNVQGMKNCSLFLMFF